MVESRNNGVPLVSHAPRAKVTKALEELARMIDRDEVKEAEGEEETAKRKGLFSFLGGGSR